MTLDTYWYVFFRILNEDKFYFLYPLLSLPAQILAMGPNCPPLAHSTISILQLLLSLTSSHLVLLNHTPALTYQPPTPLEGVKDHSLTMGELIHTPWALSNVQQPTHCSSFLPPLNSHTMIGLRQQSSQRASPKRDLSWQAALSNWQHFQAICIPSIATLFYQCMLGSFLSCIADAACGVHCV